MRGERVSRSPQRSLLRMEAFAEAARAIVGCAKNRPEDLARGLERRRLPSAGVASGSHPVPWPRCEAHID
eukprot:7863219-Alexandrium_andersonii.AAC.1